MVVLLTMTPSMPPVKSMASATSSISELLRSGAILSTILGLRARVLDASSRACVTFLSRPSRRSRCCNPLHIVSYQRNKREVGN